MVTTIRRAERLRASIQPVLDFLAGPFTTLNEDPRIANFAVGNPHELPLPGLVDAVRAHLEPLRPDWFAYKMSEPMSREVVARSMAARTGLAWDPADVAMTNAGFGALAVALRTLLEPGDEAIFLSPPWFFYEMLILAADGVPVRVRLAPPSFDLELEAIDAAITPRTRVVILNSPHNPSGRVYPLQDLRRLGEVLSRASERIGARIYLVSDEPYNRIVFDDRPFHTPAEVYPSTVITYSYAKVLLAPGLRIGYITFPPTMPDRARLRDDVFLAQIATGWAFPNADLQHAIEELESLSIDIGALERRRDRLVPALRAMGYETTMPEGTFYVMVRAPIADDLAFSEVLIRHDVLVLPGSIVELPGWFRLSLTATDEMVERGLRGFEAALHETASA